MEYFKFIDGYPHLVISSKGRVISLLHNKEIKAFVSNRGYPRIALCKDRKQKFVHVHRLVAEAFIPNPENLTDVDHIDGNKLNNNVENLQWINRAGNIRKAGDARNKGAKPIICIESGKIYKSITEASRELKIPVAIISAIAKGEYAAYHGLHFKYFKKGEILWQNQSTRSTKSCSTQNMSASTQL